MAATRLELAAERLNHELRGKPYLKVLRRSDAPEAQLQSLNIKRNDQFLGGKHVKIMDCRLLPPIRS